MLFFTKFTRSNLHNLVLVALAACITTHVWTMEQEDVQEPPLKRQRIYTDQAKHQVVFNWGKLPKELILYHVLTGIDDPQAQARVAQVFLWSNDYANAIPHLKKLIANAKFYYLRAQLYAETYAYTNDHTQVQAHAIHQEKLGKHLEKLQQLNPSTLQTTRGPQLLQEIASGALNDENPARLKTALRLGADPNSTYLPDHGIKTDHPGQGYSQTLLEAAQHCEDADCMLILLDFGVNFSQVKESYLIAELVYKKALTSEVLEKYKLDLDVQDGAFEDDGYSVLHYYLKELKPSTAECYDCIRQLITLGAHPCLEDRESHQTYLWSFYEELESADLLGQNIHFEPFLSCLKLFLNCGANPLIEDLTGETVYEVIQANDTPTRGLIRCNQALRIKIVSLFDEYIQKYGHQRIAIPSNLRIEWSGAWPSQ